MVDEFGREFLLDEEEEETDAPAGNEEPSEDDLEDGEDDADDFSTGFGEEEE